MASWQARWAEGNTIQRAQLLIFDLLRFRLGRGLDVESPQEKDRYTDFFEYVSCFDSGPIST